MAAENKTLLEKLLACPACGADLRTGKDGYQCAGCEKSYPVVDGIPVFVDIEAQDVTDEIQVRDRVAEAFLKRFCPEDVVLDIGTGWGWHWMKTRGKVVCVDFSLNSLKVAKQILGEREDVMLLCADAARLPMKKDSFAGAWSVQTYQHLMPELFEAAKGELHRVLGPGGYFEIRWLNDSLMLRLAYAVTLKKYLKERSDRDFYIRRQNMQNLLGLFGTGGLFGGLRRGAFSSHTQDNPRQPGSCAAGWTDIIHTAD